MKKMFFSLRDSFFSFLYPQYCIHCEIRLEPSERLFCHVCWSFLEFTTRKNRCRQCFSFCLYDRCENCGKELRKVSSKYMIEYGGSAICLQQELERSSFLKEIFFIFFVYQLLSLFEENMEGVLFFKAFSSPCIERISKNVARFLKIPFSERQERVFLQGKKILLLSLFKEEEKEEKIEKLLEPYSYKKLFFLSLLDVKMLG